MDIQSQINQAITAKSLGDQNSALSILRELIKHNPTSVEAWLALAEVVDNPDQAAQCYERVLAIDPDNSVAKGHLMGEQSLEDFFGFDAAPEAEPEPEPEPDTINAPVAFDFSTPDEPQDADAGSFQELDFSAGFDTEAAEFDGGLGESDEMEAPVFDFSAQEEDEEDTLIFQEKDFYTTDDDAAADEPHFDLSDFSGDEIPPDDFYSDPDAIDQDTIDPGLDDAFVAAVVTPPPADDLKAAEAPVQWAGMSPQAEAAPPPAAQPKPKKKKRPPSGKAKRRPPKKQAKKGLSVVEILLIIVIVMMCLCVGLLGLAYAGQNMAGGSFEIGVSQPTSAPEDLYWVIYENIRASNAEDIDRYMSTLHSRSPGYNLTKNTLTEAFGDFDLSYNISSLRVLEQDDSEAVVYFVLTTKKLKGPAFQDNRVTGEMTLRKENGDWKIYNQEVTNVEYLD